MKIQLYVCCIAEAYNVKYGHLLNYSFTILLSVPSWTEDFAVVLWSICQTQLDFLHCTKYMYVQYICTDHGLYNVDSMYEYF
jgi:hypothetical protein